MNEIARLVDALNAEASHLESSNSLLFFADTRTEIYDRNRALISQIKRIISNIKRSIIDPAKEVDTIIDGQCIDLLIVEIGGVMTAFPYESAVLAENAMKIFEIEHAHLDIGEWLAKVTTVPVPARDRDTFSTLDIRHVLITVVGNSMSASIHNDVFCLRGAIEDFECRRSHPMDNNVEVYFHHSILIPHKDESGA